MKTSILLLAILLSSPLAWSQRDPLIGEPKDQTKLAMRIALQKVRDIPFYLVESGVDLFTKSHSSYTHSFFNDQKNSFETSERTKIFAYNMNYSTQKQVFSFPEILKGKSYAAESCDDVCPKGLEILSTNRDQLLPLSEHFLSFRNIKPDFADSIKETIGYCWGHSSVMDDFHYLGFFDKENKSGVAIPTEAKARIEFYRELVNHLVVEEKATIIPGMRGLRELAESPGMKEYLKVVVAHKWGKNAVKLRSVGNVKFDGKKMELERTQKFLIEVEKRLISNQTPRIIFAAMGDPTWSHVLNIYGLTKEANGSTRLYVLETNYFPEDGAYQAHFIEIDKDGNATYEPLVQSRIGHNKIGKIKFTFEDRGATSKYIRSLSKFCREVTGCLR